LPRWIKAVTFATHVEVGVATGDAAELTVAAPVDLPVLTVPRDAVLACAVLLPESVRVPLPSVPAPPPAPPVGWPPVSTVLLAWMMACLNG